MNSSEWHQAIIRVNVAILLNGSLGILNFESKCRLFSYKKRNLKILSTQGCLFCLVLNVLTMFTQQAILIPNGHVKTNIRWCIPPSTHILNQHIEAMTKQSPFYDEIFKFSSQFLQIDSIFVDQYRKSARRVALKYDIYEFKRLRNRFIDTCKLRFDNR